MSEAGAPLVDKRAVVRVGLHSRSISSVFKAAQQQSAPTGGEQQYQFVRQLPVSDGDISGGNGDDEDSDSARQRDVISRHGAYRKQVYVGEFQTGVPNVTYKLERDDSSDEHATQDSNDASDQHDNSTLGPTYQIVSQDDDDVEGDSSTLQSIALKNIAGGGVPTSGATIVQYTQGPDGQLFIPVHQLNASGLMFPPGLMVSSPGGTRGSGCSPPLGLDETCKKRELRLLKNKEAAKECRRKKKEYVKCLENRVAVLENQNKTLIEELKSLKELYCQKDIHS